MSKYTVRGFILRIFFDQKSESIEAKDIYCNFFQVLKRNRVW